MKAFEKNIRKVEPYVPGEQPGRRVIKLNTNENPYPPAPGVQKAMEQISPDKLRMYPDPTASVLVDSLAEYYGVNKDQVFVGVGSDDVLSMCFLTFFNSVNRTYLFFLQGGQIFTGFPYLSKLTDDFRIRKEDYYQENGGVIFPNPNAPTGIYDGLEFVEDIIAHNQDVIVIVDEAYIDFAGKSALELIDKYENLIVVQTFSKSRSMAGMRIGYAISNPMLIKYLNDAKYSFNSYTMNQAALVCGAEAVKDRVYFEETVQKIVETREWSVEQFKELGFKCLDSQANFIFVMHPEYDAKEMFEALKKEDIYVRFWGSERIEQYMRVTVGTREEMEALFAFLRRYIKGE